MRFSSHLRPKHLYLTHQTEIIENIKRLGYLPKRNDLRKLPLLGNNSIMGVYEKYGVKEFEKGGIFYNTIQKILKE